MSFAKLLKLFGCRRACGDVTHPEERSLDFARDDGENQNQILKRRIVCRIALGTVHASCAARIKANTPGGSMVVETAVEIRTPDGTAEGFFYRDESASSRPGVVHYTDIGGPRQSHRDRAKRIAEQGYAVLLPNVFYRTGRPPVIGWPINPSDESIMKRMGEISGPLTPDAMERDASAYVDFLAAQLGVSGASMGVLGHCFSGAMAVRTAAARTDKIGAAASFHGGRLFVDGPASPHLALPRIKARLYFGHAVQDKSMPQEAIEKFDKALAAWGGKYESEVYEGAFHGWTVADSPVYNPPQAERAFAKLMELFRSALK
jgi:carboxymethylenebutenolidase